MGQNLRLADDKEPFHKELATLFNKQQHIQVVTQRSHNGQAIKGVRSGV
jgi:hypothetical protein